MYHLSRELSDFLERWSKLQMVKFQFVMVVAMTANYSMSTIFLEIQLLPHHATKIPLKLSDDIS
jgi:hypothetical protein